MWAGKVVVLGVTGGIAVYKAVELASVLRQRGASVEVVMTPAACQFVTPLTFREITGHHVALDLFAPPARMEVQHVGLAERADVVAIVPATANTLAKIALGLADNLLTSIVLATRKPVLAAPAMNVGMYENPATQSHLSSLRERGVRVVGPVEGRLLSGIVGYGRMADLNEIIFALEQTLVPQDFEGWRVVVTAGGAREAVDPVRFIGNRSSGRMGAAIARILALRGAVVTLVAGAMEVSPPPGMETVKAESTADMRQAVMDLLPSADAVIMAGAPADFHPAAPSVNKIKREGKTQFQLELMPTEDIAADVGRAKRPGQLLVTFAAESDDLLDNARRKLERKKADLMVANDITLPGGGFGSDSNEVHLLTTGEVKSLSMMTKDKVAWSIADAVLALHAGRGLYD